jgi:glycosyltransferase involved in cell wall biosynthesis
MARELIRCGHTVEVVTALPNYPQGKIFPAYRRRFYMTEEREGIRIHRLWLYAATGAGVKRLLNYFSFMITAWWGLRRAQKPDYIFVESPPLFLGITGYWAAKRWRIPFIFHVADLWPDTALSLGLVREGWQLRAALRLEAWLYRQANYISILTESVRQILIKDKQVPAQKILLLPNGADVQLFQPQPPDMVWREQLGLPVNPLLLYAGTHGYAHGMEVVLQAAQLLIDTNVIFLLVGDGSDKARIQNLSEQMGLKNIIFWPPQPPQVIAQLYHLALAGIATFRDSPLLKSASPAKMLPIMASGKPVLLCSAGEGAQLVEQAQAGIVVTPGDFQGLATAIRRLLADPIAANQLGINGRIYIEQHLTWELVVRAWLQQLAKAS